MKRGGFMNKIKNTERIDIENNYIYDIFLSEEDIEALREAEKEIARGEGLELKKGMSLYDLIKDRSDNNN